jgi:hypothetical protein
LRPAPDHTADIEILMKELVMERLARLSLPLANRWKWPKVDVLGLFRTFGEAIELYRKALSTAYVTAVFMSSEKGNECLPEDLEGRDRRW